MSGPQVSTIEGGKKRATRTFVETVDDYLEAGSALINLWEDLNKDGHPVPSWFDWPQIAADAIGLVTWQHTIVPGLLQMPKAQVCAWALRRLSHRRRMALAVVSMPISPAPLTLRRALSFHDAFCPLRSQRSCSSLLFSILAITVVVGLFPLGLRVLGGATAKWERLSFIGQT